MTIRGQLMHWKQSFWTLTFLWSLLSYRTRWVNSWNHSVGWVTCKPIVDYFVNYIDTYFCIYRWQGFFRTWIIDLTSTCKWVIHGTKCLSPPWWFDQFRLWLSHRVNFVDAVIILVFVLYLVLEYNAFSLFAGIVFPEVSYKAMLWGITNPRQFTIEIRFCSHAMIHFSHYILIKTLLKLHVWN